MRWCFFLLLSLFAWVLPARSAESALPKIRYVEEKSPDSEIVRTGRIAERPDPENLTLRGTRRGSAAFSLVQKNIRCDWTPSLDRSKASSPAAIPDAALSGDCSLLAVLERIGEPPGPYGSRLVFLNAENGRVLRYLDLCPAECARLRFAGNSLLILQKGKEEQPDSLLRLPLFPFTGKTEQVFSFPRKVSGLTSGPDETLLVKAGVTLFQFSAEGEKTGEWKLKSNGGSLVCDIQNRRIYTLFPGRIERCRLDRGRIVPEESILVDGSPEYAIPVRSWLLIGESGQAPQLLFCDQKKPPLRLNSACCGTGVWDHAGILFMVLDRNRDIGLFRLPSSPRPVSLVKVNNLRPKTNGEIRFLYRIPGKIMDLLALDDRGNLMRLRTYRRNIFQKTLLFSPAEDL